MSLTTFEYKFHSLSVHVTYLNLFIYFYFHYYIFVSFFNFLLENPLWHFRNLIYYFLTHLRSNTTRAYTLSFLFPLRSQFRMALLKPSIMVRQSHTELNLDIILDLCSRFYSISKDLHTVTNSKRRTFSWETSEIFSKFRTFMEPNFLSKFAHQIFSTTAHCRKPHESSPHRHTPVSKVILILFSHIGLGLQMLYLLRVLEIKFLWTFSNFTQGMAHASHPPWFDHTNNIWFKLCTASLCSSLQPPATSPLFGLEILLGTQF